MTTLSSTQLTKENAHVRAIAEQRVKTLEGTFQERMGRAMNREERTELIDRVRGAVDQAIEQEVDHIAEQLA